MELVGANLCKALARAKKEGWDTMQKAIEGGIGFCKDNWLETIKTHYIKIDLI